MCTALVVPARIAGKWHRALHLWWAMVFQCYQMYWYSDDFWFDPNLEANLRCPHRRCYHRYSHLCFVHWNANHHRDWPNQAAHFRHRRPSTLSRAFVTASPTYTQFVEQHTQSQWTSIHHDLWECASNRASKMSTFQSSLRPAGVKTNIDNDRFAR